VCHDSAVARSVEEIELDRRRHEAARRAMIREDGRRPLGENIEQADRLIKQAQELARAFAESRH
jgi:hypothetical protein